MACAPRPSCCRYELPIVLAAASVGARGRHRCRCTAIAAAGSRGGCCGSCPAPSCFLVAAVAELQRPPFDMPVADAEIVFGAYTEYTGLRFAFFLLSEYAGIVVMSLLFAVLFLGGWHGPFGDPLGWLWTLLKGVRRRGRRHLAARRLAPAARGPAAAAGLARASCRSPWPSWC